jgi:replicative DNA helicase
MNFPYYIQKAVDLGLLHTDGFKITGCNNDVTDKAISVSRIVDKLQPTSVQEREETVNQEAIVLCRVLSSPSGQARELWAELRTAFGMGHGQPIPATLWSDDALRAISREIDLTFTGERTNQTISKEAIISSYTNLSESSRMVSLLDFTRAISELSNPETMESYGDSETEWATALDVLKQVRVRSLYLETLHVAKQNIKADTKLEEALEFLQKRAMEGVGMMRGSIGNQGQAVDLLDSIIGNTGSNSVNWIDRLAGVCQQRRPASTGVYAFDLDIEGGVSHVQAHQASGGRLLTIAARTSVGKSSFGCQIAANLAAEGLTVGFISAELNSVSIEARIIASLSRKLLGAGHYHWSATNEKVGHVTVGELESPSGNSKEQLMNILAKIAQSLDQIGGKFLVECPWGACVDSAINSMRAMKAKHPSLRAVVLDHFHALARHKGASSNQSTMLEERAYKLMTAAKELDIDLFVLAQMNQVGLKVAQNDFRKEKTVQAPELDQIRGTDALSHVSHAVWLIRKHQASDSEPSDRKLEVWHSKVRGRQAFWEGEPPNEEITTVQGFVEMSLVQLDYATSSIKSDDTMQHRDIVKSRRRRQ